MCKSDHEREIIERDAKSHALVEENAIRKDEQKRLAKKSEMDEREFVIRQHIRFWLGKYFIDGTVLEVAESEIFTLTRADCARQLREVLEKAEIERWSYKTLVRILDELADELEGK
jgi:hypothetical protein